ncbi:MULTISPECIES: hypothetical protein [unclassified Streptomyces]
MPNVGGDGRSHEKISYTRIPEAAGENFHGDVDDVVVGYVR